MSNAVIEPTFASEADRLTFLSRLWGVTLTAQDVVEWEIHWASRPQHASFVGTEEEYWAAFRAWVVANADRRAFYVLTKWATYRLGKVKPQAEACLSTRPNPNKTQAKQAVLLQLQDKFADRLALVNAAQDLLPLVTGIVW